jgi:hypothetical protein
MQLRLVDVFMEVARYEQYRSGWSTRFYGGCGNASRVALVRQHPAGVDRWTKPDFAATW